jgi:NIPSNAP
MGSDRDAITVVELRQYTLKPGRRDELIELFERRFIEPQDAVGAHVLGYFRDLDDPDRFVWLRGFADLASRKRALEAFYGGEVWKAHGRAANDTMIDSDNVLLLRPVGESAPPGGGGTGVVTATVYPFREPVAPETVRALANNDRASPAMLLVTEPSENDFPSLPVREGENVVVTIDGDDAAARDLSAFDGLLAGPPQTLHLAPGARSRLA